MFPRAISLYLPHFTSDLVRRRRRTRIEHHDERPDRTPILLRMVHAGRQLVAGCCARSIAAGVRPGMTMAHALAALPEACDGSAPVIVESHDPLRDRRALEALGRWALRFSPLVAIDPPDGLLIDVTGCAHLFGDEAGLVDRMAADVGALGVAARVASAPTLACAWALARFGERDRVTVDTGGERDALDPLPIAALGGADDVVEALAEVGVDRIGQLVALPRGEIAERFGAALLKRLDQALGRAPEAIDAVRDAGPPMAECVFAGPVKQLEAIQLAVRKLLDELIAELLRRECGVRKLEIQVDRADANPLRETFALSRPSRDARHLRSLLAPRVESMNLGYGIERVSLIATRTGRLAHEQVERWGSAVIDDRGRERALGELLDTLTSRLGHGRVLVAEPADSHLPERSVRFGKAEATKRRSDGATKGARDGSGFEGGAPLVGDRPALLFSRPEPVTVIALTPEGPPVWFRWRSIEQRIVTSAGPERIAEEWWRRRSDEATERRSDESVASSLSARDYYKVQDEQGRWLWIFRVLESGNWFIHGLWA